MAKKHILVIEDEQIVAYDLRTLLTRLGHIPLGPATSGPEAIEMAARTRPDLILMDMDLPVVDGWEATRRLKSDSTMRAIPIIALTAHAMQSDCDRAFQAGCDDFATKPIEFGLLIEKINRALLSRGDAGS